MSKVRMVIWGREFCPDIKYRIYQGKTVTPEQQEAVQFFMATENCLERSLNHLKEYIQVNYASMLDDSQIDNIFKYVIPRTIYVPKQRQQNLIALLCDFKFDDDGIALVFTDGQLSEIGSQDIIL